MLNNKDFGIWFLKPNVLVFDALKMMAKKVIDALLVLEDDELVGIFSERDYTRMVILRGKSSKEIPACEIMNQHVITVRIDQTIKNAQATMNKKYIRYLLVIKGDKQGESYPSVTWSTPSSPSRTSSSTSWRATS